MNYFSPKEAAERYAKSRPDFHYHTIHEITKYLKLHSKIENALDVACGTGLSTKALLQISNNVYGTDASEEMLLHALNQDEITYSKALAENQPFEAYFFDIITVSSGVHWFNIDAFLEESIRMLKKKSWLIIYDNFFTGETIENKDLKKWYTSVYQLKFPAPPRNNAYEWTQINMKSKGFQYNKMYTFKNEVQMNLKDLIAYFTTQSNITYAVENTEMTYQEIETWLQNELILFFNSENQKITILFSNWIKFLQKI
ncbi:MAG: class I SAM-dependent methyltransferase [Flavobacteriia bacterium]|nr:class I SAM-dependent methyltransferase [Flavobacteriia bacterium]